jgi:hypothetical protein
MSDAIAAHLPRLFVRSIAFIIMGWCLAAAPAAFAQDAEREHIETDRDSFTPATTLSGPGRLILESGYTFVDNRDAAETHSFPELIGRYGLADWLELRVGANYEIGGEPSPVSGSGSEAGDLEAGEIESESKVLYGFKAQLTEQCGWRPRSAAVLHGNTPTHGPETETHLVATYVWGWMVIEGVDWDSAIRYGDGSAEGDRFNRWAPSTVLKVEVAERWNAHVEYFGIFTDGRDEELSQSYVSPGIHYLVTPDFEAGVRVGWGLGGDAANFFSNVGVGVRF